MCTVVNRSILFLNPVLHSGFCNPLVGLLCLLCLQNRYFAGNYFDMMAEFGWGSAIPTCVAVVDAEDNYNMDDFVGAALHDAIGPHISAAHTFYIDRGKSLIKMLHRFCGDGNTSARSTCLPHWLRNIKSSPIVAEADGKR